MLKIKRAYEDKDNADGYRILVDRLWPRGISKEKANIDEWFKDIAPSSETREEFNHEKDKFPNFKYKYLMEIEENKRSKDFLNLVKENLDKGNVTLIYAAKDEKYNQAVVLKEWLENKIKSWHVVFFKL